MHMSPLLAVSALEKAQKVSPQFWLKVAIFFVGLIVAIFLIRMVLGINKLILGVVVFIAVALIGFNWIYKRNEPECLTPYVDVVAQWFPAKDSYNSTQQQDPGKPGLKKGQPAPQPAKAGQPVKK
jgi:hypothetical protein